MSSQDRAPSLPRLGAIRRKPLGGSDSLCRHRPLFDDRALPLLIEPAAQGVQLDAWLSEHRRFIASKLELHGGILFRGFGIASASGFDACIASLGSDLLDYTYASTPRSRVRGKIYTSTEYPADQTIPLHNEMAYARSWPLKLWFFCETAPTSRGQTPLADSRKVTARIAKDVVTRFRDRGVMYVRNYGHGLDIPWQTVFDTEDKSQVESICRTSGLELEWHGSDGLTTRQVCGAVATHPETGAELWFNQAHLFHLSALEDSVRESLLRQFGEKGVPRNALFGDGGELSSQDLDDIRQAFASETVLFDWHAGDVLLVDNMLTAHGRAPFEGDRRVLVGMTEMCTSSDSEVH